MNRNRYSITFRPIQLLIFLTLCPYSQIMAQSLTEQYQKIASSFGSDKKMPKLSIINSDKVVAQLFNGIEPSIQISKKAITVCRGFKQDSSAALAAILSHELAHYYLNHKDCFKYFAGNTADINKSNEAEADRAGLVESLKNGYGATKIYPQLLDNIYTQFNLNQKLPGYPSLEERKEQAKIVARDAEDHYRIFIAASFLTATNNCVPAFLMYDFLTSKYAFKENYNNAGAARVLAAIELLLKNRPEKMPFLLPVELDAFSRLSYSVERSESGDYKDICKEFLTDANDKFAKAILLDKKYPYPYLNMACSNILLNNPDAALGNLKEMELNGVKNKEAYTIKAVAFYIKGDKDNAVSNFEMAKKYNAANADYNLKLMKSKDNFLDFLPDFGGFVDKYFGDKNKPIPTTVSLQNETKQFNVQDVKLSSYERSIQIPCKPYMEYLDVAYTETKNYDAIRIVTKNTDYYLLKTTPYTPFKTAKGIKTWDSNEIVTKVYGQPKLILPAGNFNYLQYDNIIFTENYKSLICDWLVYKMINKKTAN